MKKFEVIWSDNSFSLNFFGRITLADLMKANDQITSNSRLDQIDHYYVDFRYVNLLDLSERELTIFAKYDSVMPLFLRRTMIKGALITTSSTIEKQLNIFLVKGHNSWPRRVFCGDAPATQWIRAGQSKKATASRLTVPELQAIA